MAIPHGLLEDVSLSKYVVNARDSIAKYAMVAETTQQLLDGLEFAKQNKLRYCVVGGGYSLFFPGIYNGLVIKNNCRKFDLVGKRGKFVNGKLMIENAFLFAESGALLNQIVRYTIDAGFSGLEYQLGLPGTIGGALMTEIPEVSEKRLSVSLVSVKYVDNAGEVYEVSAGDFLKKKQSGEELVLLSCIFALTPEDKKLLWEKATGETVKRLEKYPENALVCDVFAPVSLSDALRIPTPSNTQEMHVLIQKAGLLGKTVGGVKVSETYGNTLVAVEDVRREDVLELVHLMQQTVEVKFGVAPKLRIKIFTL